MSDLNKIKTTVPY